VVEDAERAEERISEHWYTVKEVAGLLRVHINTIRRLIRSGTLPAARLRPGGIQRISSRDLADYLKNARNSEPSLSAED
jgi:excisionase family DNA binding protein